MAPPLALLRLALLSVLTRTALSATATSYYDHCPALPAPRDLPSDGPLRPTLHLSVPLGSTGYFSGKGSPEVPSSSTSRYFYLLPTKVLPTANASIFRVSVTLTVSGDRALFHSTKMEHYGQTRFVGPRGYLSFYLDGYYSSASGELCAVGTDDVLRISFPTPAAKLMRPFVTGRLESTTFDAMSLLAYAGEGYPYEYTGAETASCPAPPANARQVFKGSTFSCDAVKSLLMTMGFRLDYGNGGSAASSLGIRQRYMFINRMQCATDGAVRAYVVFSDTQDIPTDYFTVGEEAIVADGFWDRSANRLCLKGCHVRDESAVGECGIGMSFWFPAVWSIQERSFAAGLVWSTSLGIGEGPNITAHSNIILPNIRSNLAGLKYKHTKVDDAKKYYDESGLRKKRNGTFPDGSSDGRDFVFRFNFRQGGASTSAYASPITIGSMIYDGDSFVASDPLGSHGATAERLLNVSYDILVGNWSVEMTSHRHHITAEGVYDTETGSLCLLACRQLNVSSDCQILVTVQFASLHPIGRQHVWGAISSLRNQGDPLFFAKLEIASDGLYVEQVDESIWRMDLERTMALVSMALTCVFIVVQLFHVNRVPEAVPAMSITMLFVLALGCMMPLVLKFEAVINKQAVLLPDGGWLEAHDVMVRIITMATFLMQLRLLQLAWSARSVDGGKHQPWAAESKMIWICLPLYMIGGIVTLALLHMRFNHSTRMLIQDAHSYGGLILDGFLLPQIILNVFSASKVGALSPGFYIGSTMIRALPHVYDAFRTKNFVPTSGPPFMYASPHDDFFSPAWDIVIPCGATLLSLLLFLQQRLGGAFFLCSNNRN